MTDLLIPPDDNLPVEPYYDTLEGLYSHSLMTDAKMLMHQFPELNLANAIQILALSSQFMTQNDGPLFLHQMKQLTDDEED